MSQIYQRVALIGLPRGPDSPRSASAALLLRSSRGVEPALPRRGPPVGPSPSQYCCWPRAAVYCFWAEAGLPNRSAASRWRRSPGYQAKRPEARSAWIPACSRGPACGRYGYWCATGLAGSDSSPDWCFVSLRRQAGLASASATTTRCVGTR